MERMMANSKRMNLVSLKVKTMPKMRLKMMGTQMMTVMMMARKMEKRMQNLMENKSLMEKMKQMMMVHRPEDTFY
jgi:hypothetical protein